MTLTPDFLEGFRAGVILILALVVMFMFGWTAK